MNEQDETPREQKRAILLGVALFPIINLFVWLTIRDIDTEIYVQLLPWFINGIVLVLTALLHPRVGAGYIVGFAFIVVSTTVLGVLFVSACFVAFIINIPLIFLLSNAAWIPIFLATAILFLGSLYYIANIAKRLFDKWWVTTKT